jgi:hypothetical protein
MVTMALRVSQPTCVVEHSTIPPPQNFASTCGHVVLQWLQADYTFAQGPRPRGSKETVVTERNVGGTEGMGPIHCGRHRAAEPDRGSEKGRLDFWLTFPVSNSSSRLFVHKIPRLSLLEIRGFSLCRLAEMERTNINNIGRS